MKETDNKHLNKLWFDFYVKEFEGSPTDCYKKFDKYYLCPCCHFPTLTERQGFEICPLCNWEDDGQDDNNADKILGGPNQSYSLTEARQNFRNYLTMFRPTDKNHFERTTVKKIFGGKIIADLTVIKKEIIAKYNSAMTTKNEDEKQQFLKQANDLENKL
ncbi:MAG TPA: CPCC family cysteine-rich protein [Chitinophagales bacterium]|nr:CPCC family cysteine-rich protein [Chitinophagales bacterium]